MGSACLPWLNCLAVKTVNLLIGSLDIISIYLPISISVVYATRVDSDGGALWWLNDKGVNCFLFGKVLSMNLSVLNCILTNTYIQVNSRYIHVYTRAYVYIAFIQQNGLAIQILRFM